MSYRREFERDLYRTKWTFWKIFWPMVAVIALFSATGYVFGWFGEAAAVVQNEVGPSALLKKYEWFKNASAELDKKAADINVYTARSETIKNNYKDLPRNKWPKDDREQLSLWDTELAGIKASYNSVASEYNAQMAKINWAFTNVGQVPAGGQPLPREYKPYVGN
jgi:hypothetical protein